MHVLNSPLYQQMIQNKKENNLSRASNFLLVGGPLSGVKAISSWLLGNLDVKLEVSTVSAGSCLTPRLFDMQFVALALMAGGLGRRTAFLLSFGCRGKCEV